MAWGVAADEILRYASKYPIDLIVVGTHGRTGDTDALLGSVAERVARSAPCPVVSVPSIEQSAPKGSETKRGAHLCSTCGTRTDDLFCEPCRARLRARATEHDLHGVSAGALTD